MIARIASALGALAAAQIQLPSLPVLPGSTLPISISNMSSPFDVAVLGPASVTSSYVTVYAQPQSNTFTVLAGNGTSLALRDASIAATPNPRTPFIAVASYDEGVIVHAADPPYAARSILGIAGAPSDVTIVDGTIAAGATNGVSATVASVSPWTVRRIGDVPFVDEVAFDRATRDVFLTDRDVNGTGALTRISADGHQTRRVLGQTDEGVVVDPVKGKVYVANVNDGTISIVNAESMVEEQRLRAVDRVFGLALSKDGTRLFATSNQGMSSPFNAAGSVVALDVAGTRAHVVARSGPLSFPLGVALDEKDHRLFVTDESANAVDVLDPSTLRAAHAPLATCRTPWKPLYDDGTLYVPCARADAVDIFDARTLQRKTWAPFHTGGYPLAVAVYHGSK